MPWHSLRQVVRRLLRQSRAALDTYSIRMSLGFAASLLLMVTLTRLPLYPTPDFVGWGPPGSQERIQLTEVSTEVPEKEPPVREQASDVPATVHRTSQPESPEPAPSSEEEERPSEATASDDSSRTFYAAQLTALGSNGQRPQIIGGRGSFYLSIEYPEDARRKGIQGRVILDFIVDTEGRTKNIRVLQSLHPSCDSAAVAALERTRFVPGQHNGRKIPVRMRLPVRFQLVNLTAEKGSTEAQSPPSDRKR